MVVGIAKHYISLLPQRIAENKINNINVSILKSIILFSDSSNRVRQHTDKKRLVDKKMVLFISPPGWGLDCPL